MHQSFFYLWWIHFVSVIICVYIRGGGQGVGLSPLPTLPPPNFLVSPPFSEQCSLHLWKFFSHVFFTPLPPPTSHLVKPSKTFTTQQILKWPQTYNLSQSGSFNTLFLYPGKNNPLYFDLSTRVWVVSPYVCIMANRTVPIIIRFVPGLSHHCSSFLHCTLE